MTEYQKLQRFTYAENSWLVSNAISYTLHYIPSGNSFKHRKNSGYIISYIQQFQCQSSRMHSNLLWNKLNLLRVLSWCYVNHVCLKYPIPLNRIITIIQILFVPLSFLFSGTGTVTGFLFGTRYIQITKIKDTLQYFSISNYSFERDGVGSSANLCMQSYLEYFWNANGKRIRTYGNMCILSVQF